MNEDWKHLQQYCQHGDSDAFAKIVRRHIDLVWATGFRITRDPDIAQDVAQSVFSDLARKAHHLTDNTVLAGWLHRAASFAARRAVRDTARRRSREKHAMEQLAFHSTQDREDKTERLLPRLDQALTRLTEKDRDAILLRYFEKKSLAEIGAVFGVSEDAAQKRLARALERLRAHFGRLGMETSAAVLASALGAAGAQAAPTGMAVAVAAGSLTAAHAAASTWLGTMLAQLPLSTSLMKTPAIAAALLAATVSAPLVYLELQHSQLAAEQRTLQAQASELPSWRRIQAGVQARMESAREIDQLRQGRDELAKLRAEAAKLQAQNVHEKLEWQRRLEAAQAVLAAAQASTFEMEAKLLSTERVEDLKTLGLASRVWATDNDGQLPPTFQDMTNEIGAAIDLEQFIEPYEFVRHGRPINSGDKQMLLFREKEPRRLPNGNWVRAYAFVDGAVHEQISETGDFSPWEHPHIARPLGADAAPPLR